MKPKTRLATVSKTRLATLFKSLRDSGWEPGQATGWDEEGVERNYRILCESGTS